MQNILSPNGAIQFPECHNRSPALCFTLCLARGTARRFFAMRPFARTSPIKRSITARFRSKTNFVCCAANRASKSTNATCGIERLCGGAFVSPRWGLGSVGGDHPGGRRRGCVGFPWAGFCLGLRPAGQDRFKVAIEIRIRFGFGIGIRFGIRFGIVIGSGIRFGIRFGLGSESGSTTPTGSHPIARGCGASPLPRVTRHEKDSSSTPTGLHRCSGSGGITLNGHPAAMPSSARHRLECGR